MLRPHAPAACQRKSTSPHAAPERFDLRTINPTVAELPYDQSAILRALTDPRGIRYTPAPLGLPSARAQVAKELGGPLGSLDPERIVLASDPTTLMRALVDAMGGTTRSALGDGHPFVRALALSGRTPKPEGAVLLAADPGVQGGAFMDAAAWDRMIATSCPTIVDGRMGAYAIEGTPCPAPKSWRGARIGALATYAGLPQLPLSWAALHGPDAWIQDVRTRVGAILSLGGAASGVVQYGLSPIFLRGAATRAAIRNRVRRNKAHLDAALDGVEGATRLPLGAGWSAQIAMTGSPTLTWPEVLVLGYGVEVQAGTTGHFGVALLAPEGRFKTAAAALADALRTELNPTTE